MNGINPRRECEFQLLRYVPDAVRNEYVHIGVILRERAAEDRPGTDRGALYARLAPGALPRSGRRYGAAGGHGERTAAAARSIEPGRAG